MRGIHGMGWGGWGGGIARGPNQGGRGGGQAGGKDGLGGKRDGGGMGKGSDREDRALASQIDKSRSLPGSSVGGGVKEKGVMETIADFFGGPAAYANNPNRPKYNTKTMGVPVNMSWSNVPFGPNYGMPNPLGVGVGLMSMGATGIGPGLAATRAIQAATGMSGGPAIGGRSDGMGAFGGGGGTAQGMNFDGGADKLGYKIPPGYMSPGQQIPAPTTQAPQVQQPNYNRINQPGKFLSPVPGYGVNAPAYSYFGPMKR